MAEQFRVHVLGKEQFGFKVFERFQEHPGIKVVGVTAPQPVEGEKPDPLWIAALDSGFSPKKRNLFSDLALKDPDIQQQMVDLHADAGAAAFFTEFIHLPVRKSARLGVFLYHPSLVPKHRGAEAMRAAIQAGDRETGVSIIKTVKDVDAGPILWQKRRRIGPEENVIQLYFGTPENPGLFDIGVEGMTVAMEMLALGVYELKDQDHSLETHHLIMHEEEAAVDWNLPNAFDFVRGADPAPGAWGVWNGRRVKFYNVGRGPEAVGEPGRVAEKVEGQGVLVYAADGKTVLIRRMQEGDNKKGPAYELSEQLGIKVGDLLQTIPA